MTSSWEKGYRAKTRPRGRENPSGCAETISVGRIGRLALKGGGQNFRIIFLMGTDLDRGILRRYVNFHTKLRSSGWDFKVWAWIAFSNYT